MEELSFAQEQSILNRLKGMSALMEAMAVAPEILAGYQRMDDIFAMFSEVLQNITTELEKALE